MDEYTFESYLRKWETLIIECNNLPARELGAKFDTLATEIGDVYLSGTSKQCKEIRQILSKYEQVTTYLFQSVPLDSIKSKEDIDLFRRRLAFESIHDQGYDTRDTIVGLRELYRIGEKACIDVKACIREVQRISSPIDKYGWGSMQAVLGGQSGATPSKVKESSITSPPVKTETERI